MTLNLHAHTPFYSHISSFSRICLRTSLSLLTILPFLIGVVGRVEEALARGIVVVRKVPRHPPPADAPLLERGEAGAGEEDEKHYSFHANRHATIAQEDDELPASCIASSTLAALRRCRRWPRNARSRLSARLYNANFLLWTTSAAPTSSSTAPSS